ncbi:nuclear transport factor 2 family protein [Stenotrophomonas sepilia]|uniref:YybH family protein n=1 Tax=Stenotrophomonas sepilia TaxID=2860290 RepID=UPI002E7A5973|nr:nuclear transport factor 2 family protein [Stenotrophomonas sepilia]
MIFCSALLMASPAIAHDAEGAEPAQPLPDAALPAPLDRVLRNYEQAWRGGDARALAALFAEDGFVLQSNQPPVRGRTAIEAAYAGQGGSPLRLRALAYAVEGNTGYIVGAYSYGNNVGDTGKFTLTLKRERDGPWLIFSDMDNSNAPPPAR